MGWRKWVLIVWFLVTGLTMVGKVGKERDPLEPWEAVVAMIEVTIMACLVASV